MKKVMYENCFTPGKGYFIEKLVEVLPEQEATAQRKLSSRSQKKHYFYISLSQGATFSRVSLQGSIHYGAKELI